MNEADPKTVNDLLEFAEELKQAPSLSYDIASGVKVAVKQIFSTVYPLNWKEQIIDDVDLDDLMERYESIVKESLPETTIKGYKSRLVRVLKWFNDYCNNPFWNIDNLETHSLARKKAMQKAVADSMYTYPFQLDNGVVAFLRLPPQISQKEYERLIKYLNCLVKSE